MSESENFMLMDGAMVLPPLSASNLFAQVTPPWAMPLHEHPDLRLAGPLLVAYTRLVKDSPEWKEVGRICTSFPRRLGYSIVQTSLTMQALAEHLSRFALFTDSSGDTFGLRIGDSRIVALLPRVLSGKQWNALTAPIARWEFNNRDGTRSFFPASEQREQEQRGRHADPEPLHLSDEQIEQLMQATEPDGLLAHIGMQPTADSAEHTQSRYEIACHCLRIWKASGSMNRGILTDFARRVFELSGSQARDDEWMRLRLQEVCAAD